MSGNIVPKSTRKKSKLPNVIDLKSAYTALIKAHARKIEKSVQENQNVDQNI